MITIFYSFYITVAGLVVVIIGAAIPSLWSIIIGMVVALFGLIRFAMLYEKVDKDLEVLRRDVRRALNWQADHDEKHEIADKLMKHKLSQTQTSKGVITYKKGAEHHDDDRRKDQTA